MTAHQSFAKGESLRFRDACGMLKGSTEKFLPFGQRVKI
jgi:hypothetical protein